MPPRAIAAALLAMLVLARQHPLAQHDQLRTRAESSSYEETSTYADVRRIGAGLAANPLVHIEPFGTTEEGRELPLIVIAEPKVTSPESARKLGRPIVLVQAGVRAGEVDGKEAALILARRVADGNLRALAKQLVILIAPMCNPDGDERRDVVGDPEQNGPIGGVGTRENAKAIDVGRDYVHLESAEARALVGLQNRWDPQVVIDLGTAGESYHGYHLTFAPVLNPNADARLVSFARDSLLPSVRTAMLDTHGYRTNLAGHFTSEQGGAVRTRVDPDDPGDTVWRTADHRPRYSQNYVGLRNRIALRADAYAYLDFQGRVAVTTAFVEEAWRAVAKHAQRILLLTAQADRALSARTRLSKPVELGLEFRVQAAAEPVTILVGDVGEQPHPRSGEPVRQMTELAAPVRMRAYDAFVAARSRPLPSGWVIPRGIAETPRVAAAIERLRWHGITMETVNAPAQMDVDRFVVQALGRSDGARSELTVAVTMERAALSVDPGSIFVPANQRLARLASYLIEPDSDDGLSTWSLLFDGLTVGQGYPVYRVR